MPTTRTTGFDPHTNGWPFSNSFRFGALGLQTKPFGFCGGMCFSALDRFHAGTSIERTLARPGQGETLYREFFVRQWQSVTPAVFARVYAWQRRSDEEVARRTVAEWPRIRESIDAGEPVVICLVRAAGLSPLKLSVNHQVVVYGYEWEAATGDLRLQVYDPNHPTKKKVEIALNLHLPGGSLQARQSTNEPLRGFFAMGYRKRGEEHR